MKKKTNLGKNKNQKTNSATEISTGSSATYFENMTLLSIIAFLGIDFLPTFGSIEIIGVQYLYLAVLNTLIGLWVYKNPSIITHNLLLIYNKTLVVKLYLGFLFFCGLSVFFARNISVGVISFISLIIIFMTVVNLFILLNDRLHLIYKIAFLVGVSLFINSFTVLNHFVQIAKAESILTALADLKGNTGNINILSASISIKIPFLFLGIVYFKKWLKGFLFLALFVSTTLVFLSGSRAAYLSLLLETVLFIFMYLKFNSVFKQQKITALYIAILICFSFFVSNQIFKNSGNADRYKSVTSRIEKTYDLQDASINYRLGLWKNAVILIQKNPVLGIGLGNWKIESLPYENKMFSNFAASIHTHNDFLEVATETGILNGIIYLTFFILLVYMNFKVILKSEKPEATIIAIVCLLLILSYGIDAALNFPLYRPTMQFVFSLFFVLTVINTSVQEEFIGNKNKRQIPIGIIIISLITVFFSYKSFKAYQLEHQINLDFANKNFTLKTNEMGASMPLLPNVTTTGDAFYTYAASYFIEEQNYKQAFIYLNKGNKINPYQGRMELNKSIIAVKNNKKDSAFIYARKALDIRPRNKEYYIQAINTAMALKDTSGILQVHKIFTKDNDAAFVWVNTSIALSNSNYTDDKVAGFIEKGLKIFPTDSLLLGQKNRLINTIFISEADRYFSNKKYDKALESFKKALKLDFSNVILMQNIGLCYFNLQEYKQAILYLENSLATPVLKDGKSEYLLGLSYYNLKQYDKGCEFMNSAKNKNYPNAFELINTVCK
ncbi:O-antigen ligase family protein [Flavobacterium sp. W22_SRS_FP1]|uniref:O-antigen ligase family protein n=1 Tax=Flavobacterium sp. W22_SRS_FP1 TaxID=3240276 RepID=UPI003F93700F